MVHYSDQGELVMSAVDCECTSWMFWNQLQAAPLPERRAIHAHPYHHGRETDLRACRFPIFEWSCTLHKKIT